MSRDELLDKLAEFVVKVLGKSDPSDGECRALVQVADLLLQYRS